MIRIYSCEWTKHDLAMYSRPMNQIAGIKSLDAMDGVERGGRGFAIYSGIEPMSCTCDFSLEITNEQKSLPSLEARDSHSYVLDIELIEYG